MLHIIGLGILPIFSILLNKRTQIMPKKGYGSYSV